MCNVYTVFNTRVTGWTTPSGYQVGLGWLALWAGGTSIVLSLYDPLFRSSTSLSVHPFNVIHRSVALTTCLN